MLNKEQIKEIIPYQEPFLFVHGVQEIADNKIVGFYQTSSDDYYFKGHFVDFKIMPGVLVVEALAQISTVILRKKIGENHKKYHFLAYDVRSCQFYKPIFPGAKIILSTEILGVYPIKSTKGGKDSSVAHVKGQAFVDGDLKCETRFSVAIVDKKEFEENNK